jgi:hypothetical protein
MKGQGVHRLKRLKGGWIEARAEGEYTLARRWPARFDVSATARFPALSESRLAQQIRQDMWRELKSLRGYTPIVQVTIAPSGLVVTAGGQLDGRAPAETVSKIDALLNDPARRARWSNWAKRRA